MGKANDDCISNARDWSHQQNVMALSKLSNHNQMRQMKSDDIYRRQLVADNKLL